jgi:hypothetical protein
VFLDGSSNEGEITVFYELKRGDDDGCFLPLELGWLQPFQDILATLRP